MLTDYNELATPAGKLAIGWLVVEDVFTVIVLILLPILAARQGLAGDWPSLAWSLGAALGKLVLLMALVGFSVCARALAPGQGGRLAGNV